MSVTREAPKVLHHSKLKRVSVDTYYGRMDDIPARRGFTVDFGKHVEHVELWFEELPRAVHYRAPGGWTRLSFFSEHVP